jgi:hypothetical protein
MNVRQNSEDEVWSQEVAYVEYLMTADLDSYLSLLHEDFMGWPNNLPAPLNKHNSHQFLTESLSAIQLDSATFEVKPTSVRVFDKVGVVLGEVHTCGITKAGVEIVSYEKFTHTWLLTEDGWKIIGGMSAPLANTLTSL